ncbi:ABC-type transport system permease and ATPase component [Azotobacter vinelandii CA]|uniref:ABC-type transport system permease and ATPase component n=3 Tax=Azotobacter group TaxID=351 RepID=C1DLL6_AZOVD|nr:ABC-type transport system permease and ATPase component [Azotobacter vinelandii DJ]AGK17213.1 ABC-type transport system permease and ATPase component [Azotobacter vinelandii CA]AGK19468.1 ABC-type transport system permease and ATPase component [Azotobacter vinelandii CA6]
MPMSQSNPRALPLRWQFVHLVKPYWNSERKWLVRGTVGLLLLLTLAQVGLAIWTSYWHRELFDALEARSLDTLLLQIATFALIFALTMLVTALHLHVKRRLQLDWRQWLTLKLLDQWLTHAHHYKLQFTSGEHDNPDGRIAEDIRIATENAITLAHSLVFSLLILGTFVDILFKLSGSLALPGTDIVIPGFLVLLAFLYASGGSLLGLLLGRPLTQSTNRLQTVEANLRFGLARARENSESIALMHGEGIERAYAGRLFADVGQGWNRQTVGYLGIVSFSAGYGALLPVFPILVAAPQYIAGTMSLGVLMQAAQAFQRLTSALSWPIDNLGELAKCKASADRVASLYNDMLQLEERERLPVEHRIELGHGRANELVFRDLCLANPDGEILVERLDATIHRGERVLIAGDPAVTIGLFKAVAGLWPWGNGKILLPDDAGVVFLSQHPFLPDGSLEAVLSYPREPGHFSRAELHHALECAGVTWLAPRLAEIDSWSRVLPLRAQQCLGIARLILHQPPWVFLEEATDAFDPKGEDYMLEMLCRELPDSTLLTISFHPGLEPHHTRKLILNRQAEPRFLSCASELCALRKG